MFPVEINQSVKATHHSASCICAKCQLVLNLVKNLLIKSVFVCDEVLKLYFLKNKRKISLFNLFPIEMFCFKILEKLETCRHLAALINAFTCRKKIGLFLILYCSVSFLFQRIVYCKVHCTFLYFLYK